jgi:hypothetical protein
VATRICTWPLAQRHQAAVAQALRQGAVQRHGAEAFLLQVFGEAVALDLRAGEHDGLVDLVSRSQWSSIARLCGLLSAQNSTA